MVSMFNRLKGLALGLMAVAVVSVTLVQQARAADVIEAIAIEGSQRIEPETIRTYLTVSEGDTFDPNEIDRTLKSLFATGLFNDVQITREGDTLLIKVVENAIINKIAFEGNKRIKDDVLTQEVQLRSRMVYTNQKVQSDVQRILDIYRRSGRYNVTVDPKVIQRTQNRVDLVFEINEGPPTYVQRINFVGNEAFDDSELRSVILTKEERWYRIFTNADTFDPDRLTFDRELLRRHYLSEGYADFKVLSSVAELTADKESFFITITVDEGERYKFGKLGIDIALADLTAEDLQEFILPEEGDWYDANLVDQTVQKLTEAVGALGYAFVDVRPRVDRDRENKIINITFDIKEGPRVFVDRIEINGNIRTLDKVIRREFRLVEGDAFNSAKLKRSEQRIRNLGFFKKVDVTNEPSPDAPDRTVIKVDVEEQSTGELTVGVGWSSSGGPMFDLGVRERNLLGKGQDLKANLQIALKYSQVDFSFTEPYFLDRELAAGVDLYANERDLQDESSYDVQQYGGGLRLGYAYDEYWTHKWRYNLTSEKIQSVDDSASKYIKAETGTAVISLVGHTLTYDTRDSRLNPTTGNIFRISNEAAGIGGTERFFRTDVDAQQHFTLAENWFLSMKVGGGYVVGLDDTVRTTERYYLGGDSLRGFANAGVSPRDKSTDDALGGLWVAHGSIELAFPLGVPEELGLSGRAFADAGTVGEADGVNSADVDQSNALRSSVGLGIAWRSPMGPINIDYGIPITKEDFDKTESLRFSFGTRF